MKLRLPNKLQAALVAAFTAVSFTTLSTGTIAVATGAALLAGQQAWANVDTYFVTFGNTSTDTKPEWANILVDTNGANPKNEDLGNGVTLSCTIGGGKMWTDGTKTSVLENWNTGAIDDMNNVLGTELVNTNFNDLCTSASGQQQRNTYTLSNSAGSNAFKEGDTITIYVGVSGKNNTPTGAYNVSGLAGGYTVQYATATGSGFDNNVSWTSGTSGLTIVKITGTISGTSGVSFYSGDNSNRVGANFIAFKAVTPDISTYTWAATEPSDWTDNVWTKGAATEQQFVDGNDAVFDSTGYAQVAITTPVAARNVTMGGQNYTFALSDSGSLTVSALTVESNQLTIQGGVITVNGNATLGSGAGMSVGSGSTVVLGGTSANALLLNITGEGNITLSEDATINNNAGTQAAPVETQATGTLTIKAGKKLTISGSNTKYADIDSFSAVVMESGAAIDSTNASYTINNLTANGNTIRLSDTGNINNTALHLAGTTTLAGNLKLGSGWKYKVEIDKLAGSGNLELTGDRQAHQVYIHQNSTAGTITMGDGMDGSSDGKNSLLALEADMTLSGDLSLKRGTTEVHGATTVAKVLDLSVGGNSNATLNIKSGGTVTLQNNGNSSSFWGHSGSHLNLEEGGKLALDKYGLSITGRNGGGSITFPNNTQYGTGTAGITITGADVAVTASGTGAFTIGNKLTDSTLTTGSHAVTLSHAENSLVGLTISNGGSFTLSRTGLVDIAAITIENGGTLVTGADNMISGEYTVGAGQTLNLQATRQNNLSTLTINDGGKVISSRQGQQAGFLANNGTVAINGGGILKLTGNNDALGWGSGHVASVTLTGTDGTHVATLDMTETNGSETMATNLVLNGYARVTAAGNRAFNTYGGTITATNTGNVIDGIELRNNATINVGANATLDVANTVLSTQTDMQGGLTKTGAGTLTFTESAASTNLTVNEGATVSKGTATLGALNLQGGSYTVEAGSTTVTGLTTMTSSATLANAGELTLNSLTMGTANTLTNTGTLHLNGTVLFGTAGIGNSGDGSVTFANDIVFNISQLQEGENHTYTLFTGDSAVDLTRFTDTAADHLSGVTVTGRAWTFTNNGQLSYEILSRDLVWRGGEGTWTTDQGVTPWIVDGSEEPTYFATGDEVRFTASETPAQVTLGTNITAAGIVVDAGATVTVNAGAHTLSADVMNIDGVLTSAHAAHSITIGEGGVWNMSGGTMNLADMYLVNEGTIHLMDGAKVTATKDNVSSLGAVSADGTGTLEVSGTGAYTFNGQENAPFAGRLIYNIGSTNGHDSDIRLNNFEGTLEIRGRVNFGNCQFGNMTKLVFNGDRSSYTTGLWNTGVANIGVALDIIGDQLVDFYASNTINVNGDINASGVQGHLGKENNQTLNLNGVTNLLSLRIKDGTVNLKDGTIGTVVVNGDKTLNFNGALTVTNSLEANVNTNLTVGAEGVLDIAGISVAGTAQGTTITTSANNSVYSLANENYTITNANITATQGVQIANKLTNSMVNAGDYAVTLTNAGNVIAGATVGLGSFGMTGGNLADTITSNGTVSLNDVTLGSGFSQVAKEVHFDINGLVVTDMSTNYYLGFEQYVQVVNGGAISGGSTARWSGTAYNVRDNGSILIEEAAADFTTYFVQAGDVYVGEIVDQRAQTSSFVVSGGTLHIDGEYADLNITVTDSGIISGYITPDKVTIAPTAEASFQEGIQDVVNGVTFSSDEGGVIVKNTDGPIGGEAIQYGIDKTSAQVTADVLTVDSAENVTVANQLNVATVVNNGAGTLSLTTGRDLSAIKEVFAASGDIEFLNVDPETQATLDNLTIADHNTVSFSTDGNTGDVATEATVTVAGTLTAGEGATLNANLVMDGTTGSPAVLDVSAMEGIGGLNMGSSVTLNPGNVALSNEDMELITGLEFGGMYDLFNGVDSFIVGENVYSQIGMSDAWVNAKDVFTDLELPSEKDYYLFYSGANQGGVGGNVGTIYILQMPEPTTGTLSLLALAALAARRRRR